MLYKIGPWKIRSRRWMISISLSIWIRTMHLCTFRGQSLVSNCRTTPKRFRTLPNIVSLSHKKTNSTTSRRCIWSTAFILWLNSRANWLRTNKLHNINSCDFIFYWNWAGWNRRNNSLMNNSNSKIIRQTDHCYR